MPDAEYYRAYRAANAERIRAYNRERRKQAKVRAQRHASEQRRRTKIRAETAPLPDLFPDLPKGNKIIFWDQALMQDIRQERSLALLEGRDPDQAEKDLRRADATWRRLTIQLAPDWTEDHDQ